MKTLRNRLAGRRALGSGRVATATILLLAALPVVAADTPYTATGWVNGVVAPGITCTNTLGQENPDAVLYERTFVDTPQADPALTSAEFEALSGMRMRFVPDVKAPAYTFGNVGLHLWQYTDGKQPAAEATFDNLELRTYEVPLVGIERAVRLSWPASAAIHYAVEGAPTVQGPWLPVQEPVTPGMNQMAVPANEFMEFFRLRQAP